MIAKLKRIFKIVSVDLLIYSMKEPTDFEMKNERYPIEHKDIDKQKSCYYISIDGKVIHESFLFQKLFIQKLLKTSGPTIGNCRTIEAYKGKSIYPYVINYIANQELEKGVEEVFINVAPINSSSIKGIEKAGFKPHMHIQAKRFLIFYFNIKKSSF